LRGRAELVPCGLVNELGQEGRNSERVLSL
jgi:hypothetical protein